MPNPLARGISINPRTRCFVREKPKDVARLDAQRASSIKQLALGLRVPITDFEGVQEEEEVPLPARGVQPNQGPAPGHPIINGPMDETAEPVDGRARPVAEGGRGERSRGTQVQQGGQRPPSRVVDQGLPDQQAGGLRRSRNEVPSQRSRASQVQQGEEGQRPMSRVPERSLPNQQERSRRSHNEEPSRSSRASQLQQGRGEGQPPPSRVIEQGLPNQQERSRRSHNEAPNQADNQRSRASQNSQGREGEERPPSRVVEQGLPNQQAGSRALRNEAPNQSPHPSRLSQKESQRPPAPIAQALSNSHTPRVSQQAPQASPLRHSSCRRDHARSHHSDPRISRPEIPASPAHNNPEERRSRSSAGGQRSRHSARDSPPALPQQHQQHEQGIPAPLRVQQLQNEESRLPGGSYASRESGRSARGSVQEYCERVPARGSQGTGRSGQSASSRGDPHQFGQQVSPNAVDLEAGLPPVRVSRR